MIIVIDFDLKRIFLHMFWNCELTVLLGDGNVDGEETVVEVGVELVGAVLVMDCLVEVIVVPVFWLLLELVGVVVNGVVDVVVILCQANQKR